MISNVQAAPVQPAERISEIDIIRGIALFGILVVNMSFFKAPLMIERFPSDFAPGLEQACAWFIQLFFTGKFYAIFSFLFGIGFYIFMERTVEKGIELVPLYRRRLMALLFFGALHLFLLWSGDILFTYALVGFLLLGFRHKTAEAIKRWIIGLFVASLLLYGLFGLIQGIGKVMSGEYYDQAMAELLASSVQVYSEGTYLQTIAFRLTNEIPYVFISLVVWIPAVLAFFLCGFYAGKKGIFKDLPGNITLLRKICAIGFPVGALIMALFFCFETGIWPISAVFKPSLLALTNYLASLFIFPAYVALILLALQNDVCKRFLSPVAAAGRMALTNYLGQTLILVILFYGFGFGLFNQVSLAMGLVITIILYLAQVIWSNIWFKKFKYGPLEWVWRGLTYQQFDRFRSS